MYAGKGDHSDAAKRMAAEWGMHRLADPIGNLGKWVAFALADGSSDHTLYDSKADAIRFQHHMEQYYAYCQIRPTSMSVCDAEVFLSVSRRMYKAGVRMEDPREPIKRVGREDQASMMRTIETGGRTPASNLIVKGRG
jgi:hypothetical protein